MKSCCRFVIVLHVLGLAWANPLPAAPPTVAKATPDNGATDVDPATREIEIRFDQAMSRGGMSVVGGGETYPEIRGEPKWRSARRFVIPVRLEPNKEYWLSINSDGFQKFRNLKGEPAVPYPIGFRTGPGDGAPPPVASQGSLAKNEEAYRVLLEGLQTNYSHRDRVVKDWPGLMAEQRDALIAAAGPEAFARTAAAALAKAEDKHLWLRVAGEVVPSYVRPVRPNVDGKLLSQIVPGWTVRGRGVASGRWDDGVGYLFIENWDGKNVKGLATAFEVLWEMSDAPGLIIDVRANGGGDERIARSVAGCFIDEPVVYAQHVLVDPDSPGGFSSPRERTLQPSKTRPKYRGRVAVLTGPAVMSSCEAFLLMMKQAPDCALIGLPSQGSSGNPQPLDLGNGVEAMLPSWRSQTPDGADLEGVGVPPDVRVDSPIGSDDPVIEEALRWLRR